MTKLFADYDALVRLKFVRASTQSHMPLSESRGVVLVVEDEADIRSEICESLREQNYEVIGAENGSEALRYLVSTSEVPIVIVLDLQLPVMNGSEFTSMLDRYVRLARIPIVIVSAFNPGTIGPIRCSAYLRKPFEASALCETVARIVDQTSGRN